MRSTNKWADNWELQAAADKFQLKIQLLEYKGNSFEEMHGQAIVPRR